MNVYESYLLSVSILTLYNIHALLIYFTIDFQSMAVYQVKESMLRNSTEVCLLLFPVLKY